MQWQPKNLKCVSAEMRKAVGELHIEDQCGDGELGFKVGLWGGGCSDVYLTGCPSAGLIHHASSSVLQSLTADTSFISRLAHVCVVCGQRGTGIRLSSLTSVFCCQCPSSSAPYSFINSSITDAIKLKH